MVCTSYCFFMFWHVLDKMVRLQSLIIILQPSNGTLTHFHFLLIFFFRIWERNHKREKGQGELAAVYGLGTEQRSSYMWGIPHQWKLCSHCSALWYPVSDLSSSCNLWFKIIIIKKKQKTNLFCQSLNHFSCRDHMSVVLGTYNLKKVVNDKMRYNVTKWLCEVHIWEWHHAPQSK